MKRLAVLHPQALADAVVLLASGLALLGARVLLAWAHAGDEHLADFGGED